MSISLHHSNVVRLIPRSPRITRHYQSSSWIKQTLRHLLLWGERTRQRDALRALAENKHLLNDIGLTSREALDEADKPFWQGALV
jgi:uncharacterized protein YjiS (DUF1127 family)